MTHDDMADLRADARSARLARLAAETDRAAGNHGFAALHDGRADARRDAALARLDGTEWSTEDMPIDTIARLVAELAFTDGPAGPVAIAVDGMVDWARDAEELAEYLMGVENAVVRFAVAGVARAAVWSLEDGAWIGLPA